MFVRGQSSLASAVHETPRLVVDGLRTVGRITAEDTTTGETTTRGTATESISVDGALCFNNSLVVCVWTSAGVVATDDGSCLDSSAGVVEIAVDLWEADNAFESTVGRLLLP
jgi:hypothetical protein